MDEFLDAQGAQLSPTFSDHELPLGQSPTTPISDQGQVTNPNNQQMVLCQPVTPQSATPSYRMGPTRAEIVEAHDNELVRRYLAWQTRDHTRPPTETTRSIIVRGALAQARGNGNNQQALSQAGYNVWGMRQQIGSNSSGGDVVPNPSPQPNNLS